MTGRTARGDGVEDTFVRLVRQKQGRLGLSQTEFAKRLGVDRSSLSYFYGGRRSPKVAAAIAAMFDDLKDAAILFLLDNVSERTLEEQPAISEV